MKKADPIRLVRKLVIASWAHCRAADAGRKTIVKNACERAAAKEVLTLLLGRRPTGEEILEATEF